MTQANPPLPLDPNPLPADGSSRSGRLPRSLAPDYLRIDDKEPADWLAYVTELSRHLDFMHTDGSIRGNWNQLYTNQPAFAAALLSRFDAAGLGRELSELRAMIEETNDPSLDRKPLLLKYFERLRTAVYELAALIDPLPTGGALATRAADVVSQVLAPAYAHWKSYYLTAVNHGIAELPAGVGSVGEWTTSLQQDNLGSDWQTATVLDADRLAVFGLEAPPVDDQQRSRAAVYVVGHTFVSEVVAVFVQQTLHLRAAAHLELRQLLEKGADHAPHVAVILTLLRVREHQRRAINGLTDRHLRFYYERVLRLRPQSARPRKAYVVHTLRKGAQPLQLPAETAYRGGFLSQRPISLSAAELTDVRAIRIGRTIHAGNDARSRDGKGEKLPEGVSSWSAFGYTSGGESQMDTASLGFAIADPVLLASNGKRTYRVELRDSSDLLGGLRVRCGITLEKAWHYAETTIEGGVIAITLGEEVAAVTGYDVAVHGERFATTYPVVTCTLIMPSTARYLTLPESSIRLKYVRLEVSDLTVAERPGGGLVDLREPLYPFGSMPGGGETFELQLPEAGRKGAEVKVQQPPGKISQTPQIGQVVLRADDGAWEHASYPQRLAQSIVTALNFKGQPGQLPPPPPPVPPPAVVDGLALTYAIKQKGIDTLVHLTPFGHVPVRPGAAVFPEVLPRLSEGGADAGAMLLGMANWQPGTQLSLLLAVAEGSADPEADKPKDHLRWDYLDGNAWKQFPAGAVSDGTNGLLTAGIVRLDLPYETDLVHDRLPTGKAWVRISVASATAATGMLTGAYAHASLLVEEFDESPPPITLSPLPAGTIGKLVVKHPAVAQVEQPYPTFGGAGVEGRDAYFIRSSERLRHRARGVTVWDVERLVLAHFPEVERVICLPHLRYGPAVAYNELAAGHLTVLPLGRSGGDKADTLRPFVSLDTRTRITTFLRKRMSCHVTLHVENPRYEEVEIVTTLRMREGTDTTWAAAEVNRLLIEHLSPWQYGSTDLLDFGADVRQAAVVNFIEEISFVNTVRELRMNHLCDAAQSGRERLRPTRRVAVLVSAGRHTIRTVDEPATAGCACCGSDHMTGARPALIEIKADG